MPLDGTLSEIAMIDFDTLSEKANAKFKLIFHENEMVNGHCACIGAW